MKEINVSTWEEFQHELLEIKAHINGVSSVASSNLLFRGQGDAVWTLDTTLERSGKKCLIRDYYRLISSVKSQIETFTDSRWDDLDHEDILQLVKSYDDFSRRLSSGGLPAYRYMVYLRHHGFPSPLLDWTRSPYVAAYFAFSKPSRDKVTIYVFSEMPRSIKVRGSDKPSIHHFGPNILSHRRHFLQQSEYTVCVRFNEEWQFSSHGEVVGSNHDQPLHYQDVLWKINLPSTERIKVLALLDEYNLNGYSLFGSVESLMETIAVRKLHLEEG